MNKEAMFSSKNDMWATRWEYFIHWDDKYSFTLDPCATKESAKCELYYTEKEDGLKQDWGGHSVFVNPPYGNEIADWMEKSISECKKKNTSVVMLLPARTDTKWFHKYLWDKNKPKKGISVEFLKGRLTFGTDRYWKENYWDLEFKNGKVNKLFGKTGRYMPAPFPSILVEIKNDHKYFRFL